MSRQEAIRAAARKIVEIRDHYHHGIELTAAICDLEAALDLPPDPQPTPGLREATVEEIDEAIISDHVEVLCDHFLNGIRYDIKLSSKKVIEALSRKGIRLMKEESR